MKPPVREKQRACCLRPTPQFVMVHLPCFITLLLPSCRAGAGRRGLSLAVHHRAALSRSGAALTSSSSSPFWGIYPGAHGPLDATRKLRGLLACSRGDVEVMQWAEERTGPLSANMKSVRHWCQLRTEPRWNHFHPIQQQGKRRISFRLELHVLLLAQPVATFF